MSSFLKSDAPSTPMIPRDTIKRLIKDVRGIIKNPLVSNGIYYKHHDENMMRGYALILGPEDTVYADGYYFFEIDYPADYPYRPPKVTFKTNQDRIRFHPNLYSSGKVCLSMLNTWRGEQWTSCQTISSILLTMCTLFTKNPLLNEPGVNIGHPDMDRYNDIIEYKNIEIAILNIVAKHPSLYLPMFDLFRDTVLEKFIENRERILNRVVALSNTKTTHTVITRMYSMTSELDYGKLATQFNIVNDAVGIVPTKSGCSDDTRVDVAAHGSSPASTKIESV
jgi:ubiquitin-protein ligase